MKITEDYLKNIKELDKFLHTFSFSEESEARIRAYVNNPIDFLNDDLKRLFEKYDENVVDYRIQLPTSMLKQTKKYQKEIYLILSTIVDCLSEDNQLTATKDEAGILVPNFSLSLDSVTDNSFKIKNDKRKVWRYLDSKSSSIAKKVYETWLLNKTFKINDNGETEEFINVKENRFGLYTFVSIMSQYVRSLGAKKTSLRDKISKATSSSVLNVTGLSSTEVINLITTKVIKPYFNILQEIISAKMLDMDKYGLYLSFNAFDWILASTGEEWHSCIDMNSNYAYGVGMLGMCGCPDWGMLLYTDNQKKEACTLTSFHIITRSWTCYTKDKNFQVINWYPKNIRDSVSFKDNEDFNFVFDSSSSRRSFSEWDPITFANGSLAWIYSDRNAFYVTNDKKHVYFRFEGSTGLPKHFKNENGEIIPDRDGINESVIRGVTRYHNSIWEAVKKGHSIKEYLSYPKKKVYCDCCGSSFDSKDKLTYIESENKWVCKSCLDNQYFKCRCGHYHNYENDSTEVYFGDKPWEYELMCNDCLRNALDSNEVFVDVINGYYYNTTVDGRNIMTQLKVADSIEYIADFNVDKYISKGKIYRDDSGVLYLRGVVDNG